MLNAVLIYNAECQDKNVKIMYKQTKKNDKRRTFSLAVLADFCPSVD